MEVIKDYLGNVLNVGDRCIRPCKKGNVAEFEEVIIENIDPTKNLTTVEIRGFYNEVPNLKSGWTYPKRLVKI